MLTGLPARSSALALGVHVHTVLLVFAVKLALVEVNVTVTTDVLPTVAIDMVAVNPTVVPLVM